MSLIEITLDGRINKVDKAIERIKTYAPLAEELTGKRFFVAYSGGKDSDVTRLLCALADVPHELVHNHTTADAPETVRYIRSIPDINITYPEISIWDLIVKKKFPMTRMVKYCCSELKERHGRDRFIITGVRWEESYKRKIKRSSLEILGGKADNKIILNADNREDRRLFETCMKQGKRILNPIIEWSLSDVWEFLNYYGCKSNPLYERGYYRIGCVGCPESNKNRVKEFIDYPKYKENYTRAFDRMIKVNTDINYYSWKTGEDVFNWWIGRNKPLPKQIEGQLSLLDDLDY